MTQPQDKIETPKVSRPRRWRRRLAAAFIVVVVLAIVGRAALNLLLPSVLRKIAAGYDLDCDYERSEVRLINGDAALLHLVFTPKSGGDPVLKLDYVRGDISVFALLAGRLDVSRMEADGVQLLIERDANGRIDLLEKALAVTNAAGAKPAPAAKPAEPIDLEPPLKIDAFRLSHVKARIVDHMAQPVLDTTVTLNVRLSDVRSNVRPATFELELWSDNALDLLRVEGTAQTTAEQIKSEFTFAMRGFSPRELQAYLQPLGLRATAENLSMQGAGSVELRALPETAGAVNGRLALRDIWARADQREAAAVDRIEIVADTLSPAAAGISQLLIDGVRIHAGMSEEGSIEFAGFQLVAAPESHNAAPAAPTPSPATQPAASWAFDWSIQKTAIRNVVADFEDRTFARPARLALQLDELSVDNIVSSAPEAIARISGSLRSPGLAESVRIAGTAQPFAPVKKIDLTVEVAGIRPEALRPYLDHFGLSSELNSASFELAFSGAFQTTDDGRYAAHANVAKVRFADGSELLAMDDIRIDGATYDPATGAIGVNAINISGPGIRLRRDASGRISALGMRTGASSESDKRLAAASPATRPTRAATARFKIPPIEIGSLNWKDLKLQIDDEMVQPASALGVTDAGLELANIRINTADASPGSIRAWLRAPGIVDRLDVTGSVTPLQGGVASELDIAAGGITAALLEPYLLALGIEPVLSDGRLDLRLAGSISQAERELQAALSIEKLSFVDGEKELIGVDAFQVERVRLRGNELTVGPVEAARPRAVIARDADGALSAGGIKLVSAPPATQPTAAAATQPRPTYTLTLPIITTLEQLRLTDGTLLWVDRHVPGGATASLTASASLDQLTIGRDAPPATFSAQLSSPGLLEKLVADGTLRTAPALQALEMNVVAEGIAPNAIKAYFPSGVSASFDKGSFRGAVATSIAAHELGGFGARFVAREIELSDAGRGSLFKLDSFSAAASRIDPEQALFTIDEISLAGFEADVTQTSGGGIALLGILIDPASGAPASTLPAGAAQAPAGPAEDVAAMVARARRAAPLVTLDSLDLNVKRITLHLPGEGSEPVSLSMLRVRNLNPIEVGGPDAASRPPAQVELVGRLDPLVRQFNITTVTAPFAQEPTFNVDVALTGIQGDGLLKLAPQLTDQIDGSGLVDGQFRTRVELTAAISRRGPVAFDFSRPFSLDLQVTGTEFRAAPDGPLLAGLEGLSAESIQIDPNRGNVRVRSLELTRPAGTAWRDADGIHVLGWVVKLPAGESQPTTEPTAAPIVAEAAPAQPAPAPTQPPAEISVDRLMISGLDFRVEDRAVTPTMVVPLNGLDVEVRGLSNLALHEDRTIRFSALVTSGKAPLPSVAAADTLTERELFSQVTSSGNLSLYPQPSGWVKASVSGFDMASLRGIARELEISMGKGIFDGDIDLRLPGDGSIQTKSRFVLTDLQISEPPGGFLQRTLALPGTLDLVIVGLQDPDGSITIPLDFPIRNGELSAGAVAGSAVGAMASIFATAVATAPMKVAGGAGNLLGLPGMKQSEAQAPIELSFAPGVTMLSAKERAALDRLREQMRKDKNLSLTLRHELGGGDVARAEARANPSAAEIENLAFRLQTRMNALLAERSVLSGRARGAMVSATPDESRRIVEQLRELDRQVAGTEEALDSVYELLRPGAERQAQRRTRAASLELAQQRLEQARDYLIQSAPADFAQRVQVAAPTFSPTEDSAGGKIVITLISRKRA